MTSPIISRSIPNWAKSKIFVTWCHHSPGPDLARSSILYQTTWAWAARTIRSGSILWNGDLERITLVGLISIGTRKIGICTTNCWFPFLADQYGVELKGGKLKIKFDSDEGSLAVWAYDTHKLPLYPVHYQTILGDENVELNRIGDLFADLKQWRPGERERAVELKAMLAALSRESPKFKAAIERPPSRF